jgi:glyoxylase-like metal-dependent hydrolase (beta-lactamase superfamily II)
MMSCTKNPYNPEDFAHPLTYHLVDGEYDIFGDGQLVLIPTYGHSPGHQSLWVRDGQATPLVFTGDACYSQEHLDRDGLPQAVWDAEAMAHAWTTLRNLRDTHGATLFYRHDPGQWQHIRHAPEPLRSGRWRREPPEDLEAICRIILSRGPTSPWRESWEPGWTDERLRGVRPWRPKLLHKRACMPCTTT